MTARSLRPALEAGAPIHLLWLAVGSPAMAEIAASTEPDAIVLDLQHGLWSRHQLEAAVGIAGARVPVIARCADSSPAAIGTALDAGASSVLVPLIESAEQAVAAVSACRYPPQGTRSAGGVRPLLGGVEGMLAAGSQTTVGLMIETVAGVEQAEAIAAVPGVDYLFIGTGDLALSRGPAQADQIAADCARVLAAARECGVPCGIFTGDANAARQRSAEGYAMTVCGNDISLLHEGFRHAVNTMRRSTNT